MHTQHELHASTPETSAAASGAAFILLLLLLLCLYIYATVVVGCLNPSRSFIFNYV